MRVGRPLLKLPVRFCGDTLAREVNALPDAAWMEHPQKFDGNIAVPLVSPGGEMVNRTYGPMAPTEWLQRCPYILEIMRSLDSTWGRSRLMGLEAGGVVPKHVDTHYYWRTHLRIHIPVITNPSVDFICDEETVHMRAGECWLLDSFYKHSVANRGSERRIHLVLDTVGSGRLWDLVTEANEGQNAPILIKPGETPLRPMDFEQVNAPVVMSPWEMRSHVAYVTGWTNEQPGLRETVAILDRFLMVWNGSWARYGTSEAGLPEYAKHVTELREALDTKSAAALRMRNGHPLLAAVNQFIIANAIGPATLRADAEGLEQ